MSILNAKAKEDERKAEEERYKTEQIKLQSKQVELEMALEKRRGSSPAGNPAASSLPPDASPEQYPRQAQHDHPHGSKDSTDSPSGKHAPGRHGSSQHPYQDQGQMQPSPQGRPPFLKINTSVRQGYGNQQGPNSSSSQRVSPQHAGPYPQLPQGGSSSTKGPGRPYTFPALSSNSAQSSPVTNVDYQSYIPPPLTPKDDHVSPTSSHAPQQGHNLKRKSIHHDAVMDAVRAKVLRNAAGQGHQQREQLHKKTSLDSMGRRRAQLQSSSPERLRKAADNTSNGSPTGGAVAGSQSKSSPSSQHNSEGGPSNAQFPSTTSPTSPSTPSSANAGSIRSRSSSPPSATAASEAPLPTRLGRRESHSGYSRVPIREDSRDDPNGSEDERAPSRYVMDRARTDRSSEIGGKCNHIVSLAEEPFHRTKH
ncbi:hypothetical protein BGX31_000809 [Mortierella sp. GBA43]|nr:hypothetical protein BGX31_000809 [Mortierella sp. GBA43]